MDRFAYDLLPPAHEWPDMRPLPGIPATGPLNCCEALLTRHIEAGHGGRAAFIGGGRSWTYDELHARVCRIANLLTRDFGIEPGSRVLLRGWNTPELATLWFAVQMTGAIAVTTMPLLRQGELATIIGISRPALLVSETAIATEAAAAIEAAGTGLLLTYGEGGGELEARLSGQQDAFDPAPTHADHLALIGFTSGTTGPPKATAHFHRDVLAVCETVAGGLLGASPDDVFIGTSPLAFTFGLGGLVLFPLFAGATGVLEPRYTPQELLDAIAAHKATVCFTVPTVYQRMTPLARREQVASLRHAVSSGEMLPLPARRAWKAASGLDMTELLGSTEMLHAFIGAAGAEIREGHVGKALPGYEAAILDDDGNRLPPGRIGRLAVRGPTGCRYLNDPRQRDYVRNGWNITGDACAMSADGYVAYHGRTDEMIVSSGYNISGLEVENVILAHPAVAECAVVGAPDGARGQVVTAYVVAVERPPDEQVFIAALQAHVRDTIAPYKYPRRVHLVDSLPRNESGKIQRFRLRG